MENSIKKLFQKVMDGELLSCDDAHFLWKNSNEKELLSFAGDVREKYMGKNFELCSIMNARSGRCSEDCTFCAQSAHHDTDVDVFSLVGYDDVLKLAKSNADQGVHKFSLVTSGKKLVGKEFDKIISYYKRLKEDVEIKLCASLGTIDYEQALALKDAGVEHYHHNLETGRRFYPSICTTHSYDERVETIKSVARTGMSICSGGIIGLGETVADRIDMAFELRELGVKSIPINVLFPVKGTPLAGRATLEPSEVLKTMALYRMINPDSHIRYAGGRILLGDREKDGLTGGVSAALVGDLLTTVGKNIKEDLDLLSELGYEY